MLKADPEMMNDPYYRASFLRRRQLIILPDADMVAQWREYSKSLEPYAAGVHFVDVCRQPFSLTGSQDIADHIVAALIARGNAVYFRGDYSKGQQR